MIAALVVQVAGYVVMPGQGCFDLGEEGGEVFEGLRGEGCDWIEEEVACLVGGVEAGGLEEDGVRAGGYERVDGLREWMPLGHACLKYGRLRCYLVAW